MRINRDRRNVRGRAGRDDGREPERKNRVMGKERRPINRPEEDGLDFI